MPKLVLGPILRHLGSSDATVWVETDGPCEVVVLGHRARTFRVEGHYYALAIVRSLEPGRTYPCTVELDGVPVWPEAGTAFPPGVIRPLAPTAPLSIVFGSCRAAVPHRPPFTLPRERHPHGRGEDALRALAHRLRHQAPRTWPRALLLLGDQVYADDVSPETRAFIRSRRDTRLPPHEEAADFEEYAHLYREAWREPGVRWLLSTVATTMLWDDHEVHDDWNVSQHWVEKMCAQPWWRERITGAIMAYWVYQHLGNLSPDELEADELFSRVHSVDDAGPILRTFAGEAAYQPSQVRWSVCRDFGRTRLLAIDCRAGRVLQPGARSMLDETEWRWVEERARGDFDHLLVALSDPYLLVPSIHHVEAWSEAVADGVWGSVFAGFAERLRELLDLDHWAAFRRSFDRLTELLRRVATGALGRPPASVVLLSGDVHNCYLAQIALPCTVGSESPVYQAVCSPLRNPLGRWERRVLRLAASAGAERLGRALARAARVPPPTAHGRWLGGPWFDNQLGTLELDGRRALLRIERTIWRQGEPARLEPVFDRWLA